ncbi:MAG: nucleoside-diphosphate kinase [Chloroflexi bacterium]|nr:MAG: nucleoside-diphosphate kinase [Chloroflexota bacterium]
MERTLVLIKPDAVHRGLIGEILSRLERRGLKIIGLKLIWVDESLARQHYAVHEGKPFFEKLVNYITSSPLVAAVFEGPGAIEVVRRTMGETEPSKAIPGTIRGDLALDIGYNLIHGSDSPETAEREIRLFFSEGELLSYERAIDPWVKGS